MEKKVAASNRLFKELEPKQIAEKDLAETKTDCREGAHISE